MNSLLIPTKHCLLRLPDGQIGRVVDYRQGSGAPEVHVETREGRRWVETRLVTNGFALGQQVEHDSQGAGRALLGTGKVKSMRVLGAIDQILVQFHESGETRWLPWQHFRAVMPTEFRIDQRWTGNHPDHAERARLRILAKTLENWDASTGAFGRLDIDPLPHQLAVAQRVVTASTTRWLIADDVGLGKTIEVGLILHALERRDRCRRVLIVCPANLVQQWKDEMRLKFDRLFEIYGANFNPETANEMRLRDQVVVSIDLAKREEHRAMLLAAGRWDVIVFDEAHRLGRSDSGERTERFRLAEALRDRAPTFLLLTATPHQGKTGRFAALLELVRPDLAAEIAHISVDPSIVGEIVIRNQKTRVTDARGELLFRGHDTQRVSIHVDAAMHRFVEALREYLVRGYNIAQRRGGATRAIGFVMTTYRKLASSSIAAIERALRQRLERLRGPERAATGPSVEQMLDMGELEGNDAVADLRALYEQPAFFAEEADMIAGLLRLAEAARPHDGKLHAFLNDIVAPILARGESLLVFTEYRATQAYLQQAIAALRPGIGAVELINGSMSLEEKMAAVTRFNDRRARVLVSTEAGAEGFNLHRSCHVMVNYDLPWNPSRLVQRIGRLYRYGQQRRVQVFNIQSDDGFDNEALALMLERVEAIARDLASVAHENREALEADILGELLSNIDMEAILERAATMSIQRTEAEVAEAIAAAERARELEASILSYATDQAVAFDAYVDWRHMASFVRRDAPSRGRYGYRHAGRRGPRTGAAGRSRPPLPRVRPPPAYLGLGEPRHRTPGRRRLSPRFRERAGPPPHRQGDQPPRLRRPVWDNSD